MAEILAAKLGTNIGLTRHLQDLGLPLQVTEGTAVCIAGGWQAVEVPYAGQLDELEVLLRTEPANDDCQVVGRAGGRAQALDLVQQEGLQGGRVQHGLGLLVQAGLVGTAASLGDEQEVVCVARSGVELNLSRQVAACVLLGEHVQRCHLGVPEVGLRVGPVHALAEGLLVLTIRPNVLPTLANNNAGAGVLAAGENHACSNIRVLKQLQSHKAVVSGRLRVIQDVAQLLKV
mmetsp:Transcript_21332/g.46606  ORF Transcript_21332/g.46606 Transcript_21332/m.46606 type:complete len:232 (-) Transcript_21332:493-1188(-)